MSYKVLLFDKTEIIITNEQAQKLEQAIALSTDGFVSIDGRTIKKNAISSIMPGGQTEADLPLLPSVSKLAVGKICRGQYSIQNQINLIAKREGGKKWAKLITSKKWREATRLKLRETDQKWCDYKMGECNCSTEKKLDLAQAERYN